MPAEAPERQDNAYISLSFFLSVRYCPFLRLTLPTSLSLSLVICVCPAVSVTLSLILWLSVSGSTAKDPSDRRQCSACGQSKDAGDSSSLRTCQSCVATNKERRTSAASSNTTSAAVGECHSDPSMPAVSDSVNSATDDVAYVLEQQLNLGHSSTVLTGGSDFQSAITSSFEHSNRADASARV